MSFAKAKNGILSAKPLWHGFVANHVGPLSASEGRGFANKRVLITGAGGYLGSALAWQLAQLRVRSLVLLDSAEYGLYRLGRRLDKAHRNVDAEFIVGSVCDDALVREIFAQHKPDIVFHAAALKHVPLMESNVFAATEVNVLGTQVLVDASLSTPVSFVHVSTDKAVHPISVMGITKCIAEQIVLAAHSRQEPGSSYTAVRLCNVLGSTGSVAPLFARQIAQGGPVTVTSSEATRFFVTKRDAVRHLLRAAITESTTGLLLPRVVAPSCVQDLASYMIRKASASPGSIAMRYMGLRAADKLHEQMMTQFEVSTEQGSDPDTFAVESKVDADRLDSAITDIRAAVAQRDGYRLLRAMQKAVPEYEGPAPIETHADEVSA